MVAAGRLLALLLSVLANSVGASSEANVGSFAVYTDTVWLRAGEVHNAWRKPQKLPRDVVQKFAGGTMFVKAIDIDIVRVCPMTGQEVSLPLSEVYNHHHAALFGPLHVLEEVWKRENGTDPLGPHRRAQRGCMMHGASINALLDEVRGNSSTRIAAFGGASGAEFRGTPTTLPAPYAFAMENITEEYAFMALMHFLDMHGASDVGHQRFECPCTKARQFNFEDGTIDGVKPLPFGCSQELIDQGNPSCSLETYQGGYRCCENGVFLTDDIPGPLAMSHPLQMKITVTYYEDLQSPQIVTHTNCCDASGNSTAKGNIEYDVPQCPAGTPPELCEHIVTSVQPLDLSLRHHGHSSHPDRLLDLVHAWGHQHIGAIGMELWNEQTGQLLCKTQPRYGNGTQVGNEAGFLVGIPPCVWGPPPLPAPPRLRARDLIRTVARYNSSVPRHGVMSLWLMEAAPVPGGQSELLV